jgi:hypothetical protein
MRNFPVAESEAWTSYFPRCIRGCQELLLFAARAVIRQYQFPPARSMHRIIRRVRKHSLDQTAKSWQLCALFLSGGIQITSKSANSRISEYSSPSPGMQILSSTIKTSRRPLASFPRPRPPTLTTSALPACLYRLVSLPQWYNHLACSPIPIESLRCYEVQHMKEKRTRNCFRYCLNPIVL